MGFVGIEWGAKPIEVERDLHGNWFNTVISTLFSRRIKLTDREKLDYVLTNPALLKVVAITCDLGSLAMVNKYDGDKLIEKNFLNTILQKPNFKQGWTQFHWEYFFWIQLGTAYLWNPQNAKVLKETNPIQWLVPQNIDWEVSAVDRLRSLIFTRQTFDEVMKAEVKYNLGNGTFVLITLAEIVPFFDLCNGIDGNFYKGTSRIDALYKIIQNSEAALDAKAVNLKMAQQFMVSGQQDSSDISQLPMEEEEKLSIEQKVMGFKKIHAIKSKISIERFVSRLDQLKLDESFNDDMIKIASIMNVPTEVLDINSIESTYENQEKATGRQIEYSVKPKWKQLTDWYQYQYGFKDIKAEYSHMNFNQVFEKDRAEKEKLQAETLLTLMKAGVPEDQINAFLGTEFTGIDYEAAQRQPTTANQNGATQQGSGN